MVSVQETNETGDSVSRAAVSLRCVLMQSVLHLISSFIHVKLYWQFKTDIK